MSNLKSCAFGDFIYFVGKGTIPQNKLLLLDTINKNILEVGYNLQDQNLTAFFKTKDDDSFIYFKYSSINPESVYRFNLNSLKEGVYIHNSSGWDCMPTKSDLKYKADVDSYDLTHIDLTPLSNVITFTNTAKRNYAHSSNDANTSLVLDMDNENEHYILIENTSDSSIKIAVSGSDSETIIGSTAIIIPISKYMEISIVKHSTTYIVTERGI